MQYAGVPTPGEQQIPDGANLFKIAVLFALLFGAFLAAEYGATTIAQQGSLSAALQTALTWLWLLACGLLASFAVQGLGVLAHDAVHKVMLSRLWLNELVGGIISAFSLLPLNANRQFHMTHHRFSHQRDKDPEQPIHNHRLWFAMIFGAFIALGLQYRILLRTLLAGFGSLRSLVTALKDIAYLSVAFGCYFLLLPSQGLSVSHTFVPLLLVLPLLYSVRAISDHYGLPEVVRKKRESGEGSDEPFLIQHEVGGWVVLTAPWLEWLWSNVNYHEVHHKFPYLSHRYLKQAFLATRDKLPYAVVDGYFRNLSRQRQRSYYHSEMPPQV